MAPGPPPCPRAPQHQPVHSRPHRPHPSHLLQQSHPRPLHQVHHDLRPHLPSRHSLRTHRSTSNPLRPPHQWMRTGHMTAAQPPRAMPRGHSPPPRPHHCRPRHPHPPALSTGPTRAHGPLLIGAYPHAHPPPTSPPTIRTMSTGLGTVAPCHQAMPHRPHRKRATTNPHAPTPLPPLTPNQSIWKTQTPRSPPSPSTPNHPARRTRAKHFACHSSRRSRPPTTPTLWLKPMPNLRPPFPLWRRGQTCFAHPPPSPCRWRDRARIVRHLPHLDPVTATPA